MVRFTGLLILSLLWAIPTWAAAPTSAQADPIPIQEATLDAQGELHDLNISPQGDLVISDTGGEAIWVVNPQSSAATRYGGLGPVEDAQADANGAIWWTDGADRFGRLTPATLQQTTWQVTGDEPTQLLALAFDNGGQVWISEWFGNASKLYRFQPTSHELCAHSLPGGIASTDLRLHAGNLWLANWAQDRIMRYNPASRQFTSWSMGKETLPGGLALDEQGQLWWADGENANISRLNPTNQQWTQYALPVGTHPSMIARQESQIWYTEALSATVGLLNPTQASGVTVTLPISTTTITPVCRDLGVGTTAPVTLTRSTLQWADVTPTLLVNQPAWTVYQLAAQAQPYGVVSTGDYLWVTDQGTDRQRLIRIKATGPQTHLYLSVIRR